MPRTRRARSSTSRPRTRSVAEVTRSLNVKQFKPELFLAVVGAVGTDYDSMLRELSSSLSSVGYRTEEVHLVELLHEFDAWKEIPERPLDDRINAHMDAGNEFRNTLALGDALALLGISKIQSLRRKQSPGGEPVPGNAYLIRSLKHPTEVRTLRAIYGDTFFLIGAYTDLDQRIRGLASKIAASRQDFQPGKHRPAAEALNARDQVEMGQPYGQNVQDTFPLADIFVDCEEKTKMQQAIARFVELLFGHPFHTPTRDEYAMFHAYGAALRSADLSRQVGAAIVTDEGDIVALGTNEVPKAGGGQYWTEDEQDHRDYRLGFESNTRLKRTMLADLLSRLGKAGWLDEGRRGADKDYDEMAQEALDVPEIAQAQLANVIEFGRTVHAEMASLIDAARRGAAVNGLTLYTTTFPCHDCAKHIVGAGIRRVVYVEPYPKSLSEPMYADSIRADGSPRGRQVLFEPFIGIAPRRYVDLFLAPTRKTTAGEAVEWDPGQALPKLGIYDPTTDVREAEALEAWQLALEKNGVSIRD